VPRRSRSTRRTLAGAVAALAVGLLACGGSDDESGTEAEPLGREAAGSVAPLAQCRDWNRGTEEEQLATIAEIRNQVNLESSAVEAPPLSDEEATEVFDNACAEGFARGFRLYVLYARAAGFAPLTR
jgi:hypothetical protein